MHVIMSQPGLSRQTGASLIEVLVAILILSFGLLAMGGMMATAIQLPKLAAHRATATNIAINHIDRIRANASGFSTGNYDDPLSYDGSLTVPSLNDCTYPLCDATSLSNMDKAYTKRILRQLLPAGGMLIQRDTTGGSTTEGNLWIIWQEPGTASALNAGTSDNCPTAITNTYTNPAPRCLYMRFRL